jgi:hypothetical protein
MEVPADPAALTLALEGLVRMNEKVLADVSIGGAGYPSLYESHVRYRREPRGQEDWKTADRVFDDGFADCEDLSAVRAAELRAEGDPAIALVMPTQRGKFHAVVLRGDGEIEDPSRVLLRKEKGNNMGKTKICIKEVGSHCLGSITIPTTDGQKIEAHEMGFDNWSALTKVLGAVFKVASDPAVAAILPPQVAIALHVARRISEMSPDGLKKLMVDDRSTDAQKKLAAKILAANRGNGEEVGRMSKYGTNQPIVVSKQGAAGRAPRTPIGPQAESRRSGAGGPNTRTFQGQPIVRPDSRDPNVQPMYPPGYVPKYAPIDQMYQPPSYGYPPQQGYPGMPGTSGYWYPPQSPAGYGAAYPQSPYYPGSPPFYPSGPYIDPSDMAAFMQSQQQQQGMMTPEEAAAIMMWGAGSFAEGSFPGFAEQPQPQPYGFGDQGYGDWGW